jgi:guanosine-3',5'-bis(diphosphate) 3'-pyrophosphohydrolase
VTTPEQLAEARRDLGRQLAAWRKAAGYTQVAFASPNGPAGYSRSAIANVETGRENMPRSFWEMCDRELGAGGALLAAYEQVGELVRRNQQPRPASRGATGPAPGRPPARHPGSVELADPEERDLGGLLRALVAQGWSPSALSATTGLTEERVRRICQGKEQVTPYEAREVPVIIRSVLARARAAEGGWLHGKVADLEQAHRSRHTRADGSLLQRAHRIAERLHRGRTRANGEPYLTHPVAVAHTVAELGLDTTAVAAALLHDLVEDAAAAPDTGYTMAHLRADLGDPPADLVERVRELDLLYLRAAAGEELFGETLRRMLLAARTDGRALIIKIAYRLHHLRTLRFRRGPSQVHTATATRDIVIPLADRLGLHAIRRELEDLVLAVLEPEIYRQLDDHLRKTHEARAAQVDAARQLLGSALQRNRIRAEIQDRPRHHYSIYRRMVKNPHLGPQNPPRLVVVVAGDDLECYRAMGAVHRTWRPVAGAFTDLIAAPKYNMYQSLHTTVMGPADQPMDVLVRTTRMHAVAQAGVTADRSNGTASSPQLDWLDRLLAWQEEAAEPDHLLGSLRTDRASRPITVLTADGTAVPLATGATCVDLAHHLDPNATDRLVSANVNGRLTALTAPLTDGDRVELVHAHHLEHGR